MPKEAVIPVEQYHSRVCEPVVAVGDRVLTGDVIARSGETGIPPVHASISGTVSEIGMRSHPFGHSSLCVVIESDGRDRWAKPTVTEGL
ncbi:MAG: hypothetical protein ACC644_03835, partial [Candidatus Hydrothermarchaeales archaeon]